MLLSSYDYFAEISTLINSKYDYSVEMDSSQGYDDYYQYNAAIRFAINTYSESALKADVIMQLDSSEYSNLVYWNAEPLNAHEIAITQNIAKANNLSVGDILYSKHIVDSNVYDYTIKQILPSATNVRYEKDVVRNDGLIIMGYDSTYEENISHSVIVFTSEPINSLTQDGKVSAENMLYRDDELSFVIEDLLPYTILFFLIGIAISIGFVLIRTNKITTNFRRYVSLGYQPEIINSLYDQSIVIPACLVVLGFIVVNTGLGLLKTLCLPIIIFVLFINVFEIIAIVSTSYFIRKTLWRS